MDAAHCDEASHWSGTVSTGRAGASAPPGPSPQLVKRGGRWGGRAAELQSWQANTRKRRGHWLAQRELDRWEAGSGSPHMYLSWMEAKRASARGEHGRSSIPYHVDGAAALARGCVLPRMARPLSFPSASSTRRRGEPKTKQQKKRPGPGRLALLAPVLAHNMCPGVFK